MAKTTESAGATAPVMTKSLVRVYNFNPHMTIKTDSEVSEDKIVPKCNQVVLRKIGYDENDRPLYNFMVGDGKHGLDTMGYVVPVGTVPAKEIGEVEEPACQCCEDDEEGNKVCSCGSTCW